MADSPPPPHEHGHAAQADCPQCLASPNRPGSAKVAWTVAAIAVLLLVGVFFYGASSRGGLILGAGGLGLLAIIACPLVMGGMMWMMMRKGH